LPYRKKKNLDLSKEEKEYNKNHSNKKRIVIEHTIICRLKKYRIMSDIFRNRLRKYNRISDIVAGLVLQDNESASLREKMVYLY
jgi:hypothetical protein